MSTTRLVPLTVHYEVSRGGVWTAHEWRTKDAGKPTVENLVKHIAVVEASTMPGGCNSHVGPTRVLKAWIVDQRTGKTLCQVEVSK